MRFSSSYSIYNIGARVVNFNSGSLGTDGYCNRYEGISVRLVRSAE